MYGMVNRAAQELIESNYGQETWLRIKKLAGVDSEDVEFESMRQYPDQIAYAIVGAASKVLDVPATTVLENFGNFWIGFARRSGYEALMSPSGSNIFELLEGLDDMHTRLSMTFREFRPPSFHCTDSTSTSTRLHYVSERDGLTYFVVGLMKGLGEMFATPVDVTIEAAKSEGADHDVFHVKTAA